MEKINIILADCDVNEIEDFKQGIEQELNEELQISSKICNGKHDIFGNVYRYFMYMFFSFTVFIKRKKFNYVFGWQQFYALFFAFYCKLFKVEKNNTVIVCNFTYKEKRGKIGKIYKRFMKYCLQSGYIDYIHVPSNKYAKECSEIFSLPIDKFIVTTFGIEDKYDIWKNSEVEYENYTIAIGRSNRDYDFLIKAWNYVDIKNKLLIVCDTYKPKTELPKNIILRKDICGDSQFPYIKNSNCVILPIENGNICSGDTVLLTSMSFEKTVVVTVPSTLGEMYIEHEKNGLCFEKNIEEFGRNVNGLINNKNKLKQIGEYARKSYLERFSRLNMGKVIAANIKCN